MCIADAYSLFCMGSFQFVHNQNGWNYERYDASGIYPCVW